MSLEEGSRVHLTQAMVVSREPVPGTGFVMLQLQTHELASLARPGQFVQVRLDPLLPLRRALSILDAEPATGRLVLLVQQQGQTGERLGKMQPGERLNVLGPLGHGFRYHRRRPIPLLVGEGIHAVSLLFLARFLLRRGVQPPLWLAATPPLVRQDATPAEVARWLERLGIAAHLVVASSDAPAPSLDVCGQLGALVAGFLDQGAQQQGSCELFVGGGRTLLQVFGQLAASRRLPAQAAVFAPMACALGGCWGCVVPLHGRTGTQMVRACLEGPVLPLCRLAPQVSPA